MATQDQLNEVVSKVVEGFTVAKSRKTSQLSNPEQERLIAALEESIMAILPDDSPKEPKATTEWVGETPEFEIKAPTKAGVLELWLKELRINPKSVKVVKIGPGSYHYLGLAEEGAAEIRVEKKAA